MPDSISDSRSSMFSHSRGTNISNSRLLSAGENVYVTFLNFAHDSTLPILNILGLRPQDTGQAHSNTVTEIAPAPMDIDNHTTGEHGQHTDSEDIQPIHASSSGSAQLTSSRESNFSFQFTLHDEDCRAYVRRMLSRGKGYPLWNPELDQNLHLEYRRSGVKIGDMVVVAPHGGLDPLFNVWPGQQHYLTHELPTDLLFPSESPPSISRHPLAPRTNISTGLRGFRVINAASSDVSFTYCTKKEGAIISLPTGASQVELNTNKAELRAFITKNAERYYAFAKNVVRYDIFRDSLYLVTGFMKTSDWGLATYSACHDPVRNETIKFGESTDGIYRYDWKDCTASAETKSGPFLNVQFPGKLENQCLFLSGYKIALSEKAWSELDSAGETTTIFGEQNTNSGSSTNKSTRDSEANDQSQSSSESATTSSTHSSAQNRVQIDAFPSQKPAIFHPSDVINQMLLDEVPHARVAVTHDSQWATIIKEVETINDEEILRCVKAKYRVSYQNSTAFLAPSFISEIGIENIPRGKDLSTFNILVAYNREMRRGTYAGVFVGEWVRPEGIVPVAIKVPRKGRLNKNIEAIYRSFVQEAHTWSSAQWHPNIQPYFGWSTTISGYNQSTALISPLWENRTVLDYLHEYPTADRAKLVSDTARGLHFLHDSNVVHGNMWPNNILIDDDGNALVADFGRPLLLEREYHQTGSLDKGEYIAPELQEYEFGYTAGIRERGVGLPKCTKETDVYAFAMVAFYVLTKHRTFVGNQTIRLISASTGRRERTRPIRNEDMEGRITHELWDLLEASWQTDPKLRPNMQDFCTCPQLQVLLVPVKSNQKQSLSE